MPHFTDTLWMLQQTLTCDHQLTLMATVNTHVRDITYCQNKRWCPTERDKCWISKNSLLVYDSSHGVVKMSMLGHLVRQTNFHHYASCPPCWLAPPTHFLSPPCWLALPTHFLSPPCWLAPPTHHHDVHKSWHKGHFLIKVLGENNLHCQPLGHLQKKITNKQLWQ